MSAPRFACHASAELPGPVFVLALSGHLDPEASEALLGQVNDLYDSGERRFVFDLANLKYVGSLGLRVFVSLSNKVKADGAVCLCQPTADVRTAFEVTKLNKLLRFYPTRQDAIDAARTR